MTQHDWNTETDEERRIRFRKTEWFGISFEGYKIDGTELEKGWVRAADDLGLALSAYCTHKGWDAETINVTETQYLGVEH